MFAINFVHRYESKESFIKKKEIKVQKFKVRLLALVGNLHGSDVPIGTGTSYLELLSVGNS